VGRERRKVPNAAMLCPNVEWVFLVGIAKKKFKILFDFNCLMSDFGRN
jgi:hypothetical protein